MNIRFKSWLAAFAASAFVYGQTSAQDIATGLKQLDGNQACLAKETFEKLATATPSADNQFYLGYYYLRTKQPDLAKAAFEKGLAADPKSKENLNKVGMGAVALAQGDRTGAQMIFTEVLKATKNKNVTVLQRISEAYTGYVVIDSMKPIYKTTDPAQSIALADIAIALMLKGGEKNHEVYMAKGDAFYIKGEAGPAVSAYEDAINVTPSLGKAFGKVAKIYWGGRNYDLAQTNFKKAIEVDPDYAPANKEYAELYFYVRQYKPASRYMDAYVEKLGICASDDEVLRSAQFNFVAEEFSKVNAKVAKVMSSGRTSDVLFRMQGWAAYKENQYEKAIENLTKFLKQAPQKAIDNDYRYLGNAMLRVSPADTAAAIANLEKAAEMDTVDNGYKEIAAFYNAAKDYEKAITYYKKVIAREKNPALQDFVNLSLPLYNVANRTFASGPDSLALRQKKRDYFLAADSLYLKMIERKPDYLYAHGQRAKANYFAYTREEAMTNGIAIPLMENYIKLASAVPMDDAIKANFKLFYQVLGAYSVITLKDEAKAKEWFTKLLEIDPTNKVANDFLNPAPPAAPEPAAKTPAKPPVKKKA
ncbi:tetratricopeptide repeat protein [Runella slithyformis]|uniref:Tetratricopeptide TPR_1 repeat-containing protein n=1 Tax=Runella slithyformis (strain ATCC 29530 / DSM 19594 / LMG 11500 / NCIMB 11436 / LSU 4) TaxID=761193 RepID=A0A7U4E588_RUNSL|nr:tetratricopeptide repeat protein [Runella slithyformis]AEI47864.1 Tetratricopeptide TPR_1 repeat-containing protein [Runella slithyformis DSM 19594]